MVKNIKLETLLQFEEHQSLQTAPLFTQSVFTAVCFIQSASATPPPAENQRLRLKEHYAVYSCSERHVCPFRAERQETETSHMSRGFLNNPTLSTARTHAHAQELIL